jgi:hypothetical protein
VLTVDAAGLTLGQNNGVATVTATASGFSQSVTVRVAPDYRGNWVGTYVPTACARDATFPLVNFCAAAAAGGPQPMTLRLTQDHLQTAGTLSVSDASADFRGTVNDDGSLSVTATLQQSSAGLPFSILVAPWQSSLQSGQMIGQFVMNWTTTAASGSGQIQATLQGVVRSATFLQR